ncbi:FAD-dependent oxidoreductase [Nesterenkonia sandarakina]|uniref:2-polyprenyl-6-methoxyphenol hydroxylase-like FAD-dependent oxidoreductase n=1 Tax=Nesterenkonia sandarakina TaxID=272918 RepID=A0A7Z0E6J9_9MICC|nr:FAD-dependent oxidoreductase [Nesterenkonia sandarakina]NYJ15793.1 2-polyprenyl-6-methoxyphenol hydroxylase-like FAD-dependent oxidoreductase [Nesterenkonia sandarakina]
MSSSFESRRPPTAARERDCVIAGGGPAGMVLGYLLARAGLEVTVVEKHRDFFRDFRGDTVHPSTLTLLGELGLRERFLALPVTRLSALDAVVEGQRMTLVDFGVLRGPDDFLVLAPQWDFLDFLAREARRMPGFDLQMGTQAVDLLDGEAAVRGLRVRSSGGEQEIRARLTVAADGRTSLLREAAGLEPAEFGVPIDVLWFSLPKPSDPPPATLAYVSSAGMVLTIDRGETYQSGLIVKKGVFPVIQQAGIAAFRTRLVQAAPVLAEVAGSLTDWEQIKLLTVQINRLPRWHRPGFIAIGDAAHAMSPMFGVGVNYAIQDAVALANVIIPQLRQGTVTERSLIAVQTRRQRPVKLMQAIQGRGHRVIARATVGHRVLSPGAVRLLRLGSPVLRRILAHLVGVGLLPEHVQHHPAEASERQPRQTPEAPGDRSAGAE